MEEKLVPSVESKNVSSPNCYLVLSSFLSQPQINPLDLRHKSIRFLSFLEMIVIGVFWLPKLYTFITKHMENLEKPNTENKNLLHPTTKK